MQEPHNAKSSTKRITAKQESATQEDHMASAKEVGRDKMTAQRDSALRSLDFFGATFFYQEKKVAKDRFQEEKPQPEASGLLRPTCGNAGWLRK